MASKRPSTNSVKASGGSPRGAVSAPKSATGGGRAGSTPVKQSGLSQSGGRSPQSRGKKDE